MVLLDDYLTLTLRAKYKVTQTYPTSQFLANEEETIAVGESLGRCLSQGASQGIVVYLEGQLGAGKTTITRGILRSLGHKGSVKSPTYTLVEPYENLAITVYHFDLYRLGDPEELDYMGIRDYFTDNAICLVEWSNRGIGFLPEADIRLELRPELSKTGVAGRRLIINAATDKGNTVLLNWSR